MLAREVKVDNFHSFYLFVMNKIILFHYTSKKQNPPCRKVDKVCCLEWSDVLLKKYY